MKRFLFVLPLLVLPSLALALEPSPDTRSGLAPADYPVGSRVEDKQALGGFGDSKNFSLPLENVKSPANQVSLILGNIVSVGKEKTKFRELFVVNRTGKVAAFGAQDSSLFLVQQAQDAKKAWRPIEERFNSFCGNSYHRVFLEPNRMWKLKAPIYAGDSPTQFRFALSHNKTQVLSAPFAGTFSQAQFDPPKKVQENSNVTTQLGNVGFPDFRIIRPETSFDTAPKIIQVPPPAN